MKASKKRPRSALPTRDRILDEVERLITRKGVYGFKLQDVAEPLDLKVPAIYKHFKNRDDVLVEVARRFIVLLAVQFQATGALGPEAALRAALNRFVEFTLLHPAYVRLALVDFATPDGGMAHVKRAAGPLAGMHRRLRALLRAGVRSGRFRWMPALDFYRIVKAALLIKLVSPDDALLLRHPSGREVRAIQRWLWDVASAVLRPRGA